MLDFNKRISYIYGNSYAHMIVKPLQLRLSGLNPNCVRSDNRDYNGFFVLSRVPQTKLSMVVDSVGEKTKACINKVTKPRSVITATTQHIVKVTMRLAIWMNVISKSILELLQDNDLGKMTNVTVGRLLSEYLNMQEETA